jgi:hypothetical protein
LQAITCLFVPQQGELSGAELGPSSIKIDHYTWVLSQRSLTSLRLLTSWAESQVLQQGITDIAQQLQQLRDLALIDLNVPHSSRVTWGQLAPLAACTLLTRLELENFSLSKPEVEDQDHDAAEAVPGVQPALHAQIAVGVQPAWHLTSLRKLCMSSLGPAVWQSPLSCFAPNLTELGHVSDHSCAAVAGRHLPSQRKKPASEKRNQRTAWLVARASSCLLLRL